MTDLNLSMFRSNDIRTPVARLPDELARRLARAEAVYFQGVLKVPGVVVAHDARASGPHMLEMATEEYTRAGLDVVMLPGISGVCQLYYAAMRHRDLAAVMFGASHNPAGDTGRKIMGPNLTPIADGLGPEGGLACIRDLYIKGASLEKERRGRVHAFDALPGYVAYSLTQAGVAPGSLRPLRILHDYLYGAGGRELMLGFEPTGASLEPLHFAADGAFRLGDPNPVKQEVIAPALQRLREEEFDVAMFYDGDADRLDVYVRDGTYLASSFVYATILPYVRRRHDVGQPIVLVDTKTNPLAALAMVREGVQVELVKSGHSHIKHRMYGDSRIIGVVEESAHFYDAFELEGQRFCTENTLFFSLLVARVLLERPERFADTIALQSKAHRARDWGHKFPSDDHRHRALEAVAECLRDEGAVVIDRLPDGSDIHGHMARKGLPFELSSDLAVPDEWLQVTQRASTSEDHLARWEIVGSDARLVRETKERIQATVSRFGAGPEYQG